jgi:hypothetical protein
MENFTMSDHPVHTIVLNEAFIYHIRYLSY